MEKMIKTEGKMQEKTAEEQLRYIRQQRREQNKRYYAKHRDKLMDKRREKRAINAIKPYKLADNLKRYANRAGLDYDFNGMNPFEAYTSLKCAICGKKDRDTTDNRVLRLDMSKGYTLKNCWGTCARCYHLSRVLRNRDASLSISDIKGLLLSLHNNCMELNES